MINYKIHFLRHGFTDDNINNILIAQHIDNNISKKAIDLIDKYKKDYKYPNIDKAYSSPKKRCKDTVKKLYNNTYIDIIDDFDDLDMGDFEGKSFSFLNQNIEYVNWMKDIYNVSNKCESFKDFEYRVENGINYLLNDIMKNKVINSLVCTHSMVLMSILSRFCIPKTNPFYWNIGYLKGVTVYFNTSLWGQIKCFEASYIIPYGLDSFK